MPDNYKHCYIIFEFATIGYVIREELIPFDDKSFEDQYYKIRDSIDELMIKGLNEEEIVSTIDYVSSYNIKSFKEQISPYNDFTLLDMQSGICKTNIIYCLQTVKKITNFIGLLRYDASFHNINLKSIKDYYGNNMSVELYLN